MREGGNTTVEASLLRSNEREHFCFSSLSLPSNTLTDVNILLNFPHITDLDLSNNDLEELPLLSSFKCLKTLNLCNNRLKHLPPISNCTELIKLDLSGNILTDLSTIGVLPELRELYLQCNCISTFDDVSNFPNLIILDVSCNKLSDSSLFGSHPDFIHQLGLTDAYLRLSSPPKPPPLQGLKNLRFLDLSENPSLCIFSSRGFRSTNEQTPGDCILPSRIEKLLVADCSITHLQTFQCLRSLQKVDLSGNKIVDLTELGNLKSASFLSELNLKENPLCGQENYRLHVILQLPQLALLDDEAITEQEKVFAEDKLNPSPDVLASKDHRINLLHAILQPQRIFSSTMPTFETPYPILVIVGPAGTWKHSLQRLLVTAFPDRLSALVAHTDRKPRQTRLTNEAVSRFMQLQVDPAEANSTPATTAEPPLDYEMEVAGEDYTFVDPDTFNCMRARGEFLETVKIAGSQYGLTRAALDEVAVRGRVGLLCAELEGLLSLMRGHFRPQCILCLPTDLAAYERRLRDQFLDRLPNAQPVFPAPRPLEAAGHVTALRRQKADLFIRNCLDRVGGGSGGGGAYEDFMRTHPGFFEAVVPANDLAETYDMLRRFVERYLGNRCPCLIFLFSTAVLVYLLFLQQLTCSEDPGSLKIPRLCRILFWFPDQYVKAQSQSDIQDRVH